MMVTMSQIKAGVKKYITADVLGQITDWRRWVIGAFVDPYLNKLDVILNEKGTRSMLASISILDEESEHFNLDKIREMFMTQAREYGRVSVNIPLAGPYFIGEQDVNKIYEYISIS